MFVDEALSPPTLPSPSSLFSSSDVTYLPSLPELPSSPDPLAGLYIQSRTGEALELITKGRFKAVPHFVKGVRPGFQGAGKKVARNTLAVFTQPNLGEVVDGERGITFAEFARGVVEKNTTQ
jgi:hypothetical protein